MVALVAEGLSNDEIGQRLCKSLATAKTYVSRAMTRLPAGGRAQLVVMAYDTGLTTRGVRRCSPATGGYHPGGRQLTPADGCPVAPVAALSRSPIRPRTRRARVPDEAVAIAAIVMSGVFLSVVAWQLLGIARSAVTRDRHDHARHVHTRLQALEHLHHTDGAPADPDRSGTP